MKHTYSILRRAAAALCAMVMGLPLMGADPTATLYNATECLGSARPYTAPEAPAVVPDSLTAVFINHVGRHGARFPASANASVKLAKRLAEADSAQVLTPEGQQLMTLVDYVIEISHNRWGALDSLGMAEQRGIASRMFRTYPQLFLDGGKVHAISSYSPRCVMSMDEFTHQLCRLNNNVEISTLSGRVTSPLMRPFDTDTEYVDWLKSRQWEAPYLMFFATTAPVGPARRLFTNGNELSGEEAQDLSLLMYNVLRGLPAMGMAVDLTDYFTLEELNALWACANLRHYLARTATTLSTMPAEIAAPLLLHLIETTDKAAEGTAPNKVELRFGHAETLMPLLSLMRLRGCYYLTNYFDTVAQHWCDFDTVPMAANLQIILMRNKAGKLYVRLLLNEQPIPLEPNSDDTIIPWERARTYLMRCLPQYMQI